MPAGWDRTSRPCHVPMLCVAAYQGTVMLTGGHRTSCTSRVQTQLVHR